MKINLHGFDLFWLAGFVCCFVVILYGTTTQDLIAYTMAMIMTFAALLTTRGE